MNVQPQLDRFVSLEPPAPRRRRARRLSIAALAAAATVSAILGARYFYPHAVQGEIVRPANLAIEISGPGTLDALSQAAIASRIQSRIEELAVDRNDVVSKGAILARLSFDDLAGELSAAEASAHAAERGVSAAQAYRDRAAAALAKAQAAHQRQSTLLAKGVASEAGFEDALAARREAEADLVRAQRDIERAEAERDAARARIDVARSQRDDSVLRAPLAGIVISRAHHVGEVLTPGAELLRIVDPASIVLTARLDESAMAVLRPGQAAAITFGQLAPPIPGHVLRLGREVDQETREFELDIALDALPPNWALGQRAVARIAVDDRLDALAVPKSFIARRGGRPGLWVASGGRAYWREVALGTAGVDRAEILRGLSAGDIVLMPDGLYPLMRVRLLGATS